MSDTDTYDAATITVMRQALGNPPFDAAGPLTAVEAGHRLREAERLLRNLKAAVFHGVPVVGITPEDRLVARLGAPKKETTE